MAGVVGMPYIACRHSGTMFGLPEPHGVTARASTSPVSSRLVQDSRIGEWLTVRGNLLRHRRSGSCQTRTREAEEWHARGRWVDVVDVRLDVSGERVFEGADGLAAGVCVREERVVGEQERVCLADGDVDGEPVTRRRGVSGIQPVVVQPGRNSGHAVGRRRNQRRDLKEQIRSTWLS